MYATRLLARSETRSRPRFPIAVRQGGSRALRRAASCPRDEGYPLAMQIAAVTIAHFAGRDAKTQRS